MGTKPAVWGWATTPSSPSIRRRSRDASGPGLGTRSTTIDVTRPPYETRRGRRPPPGSAAGLVSPIRSARVRAGDRLPLERPRLRERLPGGLLRRRDRHLEGLRDRLGRTVG